MSKNDFIIWVNYVKEQGFGTYFKALIPQFLVITIPIFVSLPEWASNFLGMSFIGVILFLLLIVQIYIEYRKDIRNLHEVSSLQTELESIQEAKEKVENEKEFYALTIEDNQRYFLIMLFRKLGLSESDRISLYYRNSMEKDFDIVARYSTSNSFKDHSRPTYPHDQGYISKCWETKDDDFYIDNIPEESYLVNIEYFAAQINMSVKTLQGLKMKSRSFYVKNIKNSSRDRSIGVIVIESVKPKIAKLNREKLREYLDSVTMEYLYQLMDNKLRGR